MPENNHPTLEQIMEFVSLSKNNIKREKYKDYFSLISHFVYCDKCSAIKDEMKEFSDMLDDVFSKAEVSIGLELKIYESLKTLNAHQKLKDNKILFALQGKMSKEAGKSVIQKIPMDYEYARKMQVDGEEYEKYDEITDSNNNIVSFNEEMLRISLKDDGCVSHSVLIIPENSKAQPLWHPMKKVADTWEISCSCPEDEYDIVIF